MTNNKILVISGDAGGAAAIKPVIDKLYGLDYQVKTFAYGPALVTFEGECNVLPSHFKHNHVCNILDNELPILVLTSTSVNSFNWERHFTRECNIRKIPTISVLDFWTNLDLRFFDSKINAFVFPEWLAVMDDKAREDMEQIGFPLDRIEITGNPSFENIEIISRKDKLKLQQEYKENNNIDKDCKIILFVSQPLHYFHKKGFNDAKWLGFDESDVLDKVVSSINDVSKFHKEKIHLIVRPHPNEINDYILDIKSDAKFTFTIDIDKNQFNSLFLSDMVIGMHSNLLIESLFMGNNTIRYVHKSNRNISLGSEFTMMDTFSNVSELCEYLIKQPLSTSTPVDLSDSEKSSGKVCQLVKHVLLLNNIQ